MSGVRGITFGPDSNTHFQALLVGRRDTHFSRRESSFFRRDSSCFRREYLAEKWFRREFLVFVEIQVFFRREVLRFVEIQVFSVEILVFFVEIHICFVETYASSITWFW